MEGRKETREEGGDKGGGREVNYEKFGASTCTCVSSALVRHPCCQVFHQYSSLSAAASLHSSVWPVHADCRLYVRGGWSQGDTCHRQDQETHYTSIACLTP